MRPEERVSRLGRLYLAEEMYENYEIIIENSTGESERYDKVAPFSAYHKSKIICLFNFNAPLMVS